MIVTRLLEGGSALKSGQILQGDIIYSIDDVSTSGWSMLKVWAMCKRFLEATMQQAWPHFCLCVRSGSWRTSNFTLIDWSTRRVTRAK